jgi:hypothetical protein
MFKSVKIKFILIAVLFLMVPVMAGADTLDQEINFNIDSSYDSQGRKEIRATLVKITSQLYFYVDKVWWQDLNYSKKQSLEVIFNNLAAEFEKRIYPTLTSSFGSESSPGIDGDERITALIHPMITEAGGYFNSGDLYEKLQNPISNEREMIYLNSRHIEEDKMKGFLAHEFTHLITANQKDLLREVVEDVWLNEARAEYSATLLGYNDVYKESILEKRVKGFLNNPSVSLVEWLNRKEDYGAVNLFTHYLVDHYGVKILTDSLQSDKVGIESINYALAKNNYDKDFEQVFKDWAITLLVNDCDLGDKYCYLNKHFKDFRIIPTVYYLPGTNTILSTYHDSTYWAANWQRFVGGGNNLILEFEGYSLVQFEIPYLLCDLENICLIEFLNLDEEQKAKINISKFGSKYNSLTAIPFISSKISGFNDKEKQFSFFWRVTIEEKTEAEKESELISQLLAQIDILKAQIAEYQAKINVLLAQRGQTAVSCDNFGKDLYFGISDSTAVRCLQEFLKSQGSGIYPEGLVTGNFLSLTQTAVIRFQEKYVQEILTPLGIEKGTGYVGPATRAKINQLLR